VYGIPDDSLNSFSDTLRRDGGIARRHVRREEAAGLRPAAEAVLTGKLAVRAGRCRPGSHAAESPPGCQLQRMRSLSVRRVIQLLQHQHGSEQVRRQQTGGW
jgi:pyruvate dehydrogenase (quinone)